MKKHFPTFSRLWTSHRIRTVVLGLAVAGVLTLSAQAFAAPGTPDDFPFEEPPPEAFTHPIDLNDQAPEPRMGGTIPARAAGEGSHQKSSPTKNEIKRAKNIAGHYWPVCNNGKAIRLKRFRGSSRVFGNTDYYAIVHQIGSGKGTKYYCTMWFNDSAMQRDFNYNFPRFCAIAIHEAGHLKGRRHVNKRKSIMWPYGNELVIPKRCK